MYIYPSSPESASSLQSEESAAIKIQAGFRGYRVRKEIHKSSKNPHPRRNQRQRPKNNALMENQANSGNPRPSGEDQRTAAENGGKSVEDRSATKIQAGFRGFLVRKKQKIATDAAVKIQAGFRGFKTRKELKQCEPIV
ncbi:abnormal spindle-like microcephaly-associated protein homolog [Drosophila teissieri]|uniref:abnormal spindle-like microcephaly-associated protein homolog n=1 Tax=Drosophila teissieri TaxID=7243 RepID=UPI001CBA5B19|nr:abnormal spindle-like microcephaly-associated protein homolog [Drosophila teissieri]